MNASELKYQHEAKDQAKILPVEVKGKSGLYKLADVVNAMVGSQEFDLQQEKAKLAVGQSRRLLMANDEVMAMNNDNRTAFITYPQIPGDKPMCDTEFWQWLDRQQPDSINRFIGTLKLWLAPYGFDITKHVLPAAQLERHKYVYEHFWWRYWDKQKR